MSKSEEGTEQEEAKIPNAETIKAIQDLKSGKGEVFDNVDDLFDSWEE